MGKGNHPVVGMHSVTTDVKKPWVSVTTELEKAWVSVTTELEKAWVSVTTDLVLPLI